MRLPPARLRNLSVALLEKRGVPADSARLQANLLLEAELRGLPSHGLQRLPLLLSRLDKGLANPTTRGNGTWRRASFLSVDGERGLGPVVMMDAMRVTRRILQETGLAVAAIRNANHMGMLAYYAEAAARDGLIGIVMSTSEALVHPFGGNAGPDRHQSGRDRHPCGWPPFRAGSRNQHRFHGQDQQPCDAWSGDPARLRRWTQTVARQPIRTRHRQGRSRPSATPRDMVWALRSSFLSRRLPDRNLAPDVNGTLDDIHPANKGDLLILIHPSAGAGSIPALAAYLDRLRLSRPLDPTQPVAIPGDRAPARRAAAAKTGIELPQPLFDHLTALEAA